MKKARASKVIKGIRKTKFNHSEEKPKTRVLESKSRRTRFKSVLLKPLISILDFVLNWISIKINLPTLSFTFNLNKLNKNKEV